jgi:hypothetical protein
MQKTYSVSFDNLSSVNRELHKLVTQGFKITCFQLLQTDKTTDFNYYMAIVYEEQEIVEGWGLGYAARVAEEKAGYGPYEK